MGLLRRPHRRHHSQPDDRRSQLVGHSRLLTALRSLCRCGNWRAGLCCLTLLAYLALNATLDANANLLPLLSPVGPEHRAALFDASGKGHQQALTQWQGRPVHALYAGLGDDPWKPRKALVWTQPNPGLSSLSGGIRLLAMQGQQGQFSVTPSLQVSPIAPAGREWISLVFQNTGAGPPPNLPYGTASVLSRNNYYVWPYQADLLLRGSGWTDCILMPHTQGNVRVD